MDDLRKVPGVTAKFAEAHGFEVLRVVRQAAVEGAKGARSGQHGDG